MNWRLSRSVFVLCIVFPAWVQAQVPEKVEVKIGVQDPKYIEIENEFEKGLPAILSRLKMSIEHVKKNEWDLAKEDIRIAGQIRDRDEAALTKDSHYKEIASYVDRIESKVDKALGAMDQKKRPAALDNLVQAYRLTDTLSKSPVLKLSASEIALGNASHSLHQGNYRDAGAFLQIAIDHITTAMQDPNLKDSAELNRLKNQIMITQKQVVLGEMKDEERLKKFYPGLSAARENTLNSYYSIWNRSDYPWMQY